MKHGSIIKAMGHDRMIRANCIPIRGYSGYFFGPTKKGCQIYSGSRSGEFLEKKLYQKRKPNGPFYVYLTDDQGGSRHVSFKQLVLEHIKPFQIVERFTREELDQDFEHVVEQLTIEQLRHDVVRLKYTEEELTKLRQQKQIDSTIKENASLLGELS